MPPPRAKPRPVASEPHVLGERFADPDLVDRIFDYLVDLLPDIRSAAQGPLKDAIRREFGGAVQYVRSDVVQRRQVELRREVRRMFDGRNATQVARVLCISRATVYRLLKQPGGEDVQDRCPTP